MNHAEVYAEQLHGKCAGLPRMGAVRHFQLRRLALLYSLGMPLFAGKRFADYFLGGLKQVELS